MKKCYLILSITVFLCFLGSSYATLFSSGSTVFKYISKADMEVRSNDEAINQYTADYLYGGKSVDDLGDAPVYDNDAEEKNFQFSERVLLAEKIFLVSFLVILFLNIFYGERFLLGKAWAHILLVPFIYLFAISTCAILNGGKGFSELSIWAHGTRWGSPFLLWVLYAFPKQLEANLKFKKNFVKYFAAICVSMTFAAHGWEAFHLHPPFQDLLLGFFAHFGFALTMPALAMTLKTIAIKDAIISILIVVIPFKFLLIWMTFWGIITALSRPATLGFSNWYMAAERFPNGLLPLFLLFFLMTFKKETTNE